MMFNLWQLFFQISFVYILFQFCSFCVIFFLQFKRKCSGVSFTLPVHSGAFWGGFSVNFVFVTLISIECPVFSLAILEIPFLHSGNIFQAFLEEWPLVLTSMTYVIHYFVCFEFSHLLVHLLMESILLPCCISEIFQPSVCVFPRETVYEKRACLT